MTDREQLAIEWARHEYADRSNNDIEIDDKPATSEADDGVWVAAWVWVPNGEIEPVDDED